MDDWLKDYDVEIDEQEIAKLKQYARVQMLQREDKFETSTLRFLCQIIGRELRVFCLLALMMTIIMSLFIRYMQDPYLIVAMHSGMLGAAVLLELFRMFRYRMNEVQFPTKLGMGRLFLYKMIALSLVEFILIFFFMGMVQKMYLVDGYLMIAYGILPNLLICAVLLWVSQCFHSLLSMLIIYSVSSLALGVLFRLISLHLTMPMLHSLIVAMTLLAVLLFLWMIKRVYQAMKNAGGELSWN